jgi:1-acyl-sn-glycerol-3-phosphate acyltransferase
MMEQLPDNYQTTHSKIGYFRRTFPCTTFYVGTMATVWKAARKAKSGNYTDADWYGASATIRQLLEKTGCEIQIENLHVFKRLQSPAVIIGNHMSTAETFLLPSMVRPFAPVTFVVKQSLVDYPVFGHVMRSRNPVVVARQNPRDDLLTVLREGEKRLQQGYHLIIFPQRTRTPDFNRDDFNSIGIKLARNANVPVVPLALQTSAWGNGKRFKDFGVLNPAIPLRFAFGEPLEVQGNGKQENEAVIEFIENKLSQWKGR